MIISVTSNLFPNTGALHQFVIELNGQQTEGLWAPITQEPQNQPVVNGDLGEAERRDEDLGDGAEHDRHDQPSRMRFRNRSR